MDTTRQTLLATSQGRLQGSATWKEILSQGRVWQTVLQELSQNALVEKIISNNRMDKEWIFVGCGTSFYLAETAAACWAFLTGQRARALPASEVLLFPALTNAKGANTQAVVISRSGKTSEAVRAAEVLSRKLCVPTLGMTCGHGTALEQACDSSIVLQVADENSMVMTRSFTSMLLSLQYVAARWVGNSQFVADLHRASEHVSKQIQPWTQLMEAFVAAHSFVDYVFLGQGPFYGIAREASLKVMEMSCSYSQFFHSLEFRHGPKAIVSPKTCLTFLLSEAGRDIELEVLKEMKELGAVTIAICNRADATVKRVSDLVVEIGLDGHELARIAPFTIPAQLLGFFTGIQKGLNPDQPKNLTRVVLLD